MTVVNIPIPAGVPAWVSPLVQSIKRAVEFTMNGPQRLGVYTVATAPTASKWTNFAIIISDESGGRTIATSDGTHWKRVKDGANIS